jgi:hypothetical protein
MMLFDFLFYYLTMYFEEHPEKLSWSSPLERVCYIVGLVSILWLRACWQLITYIQNNSHLPEIPLIHVILVGLIIMQLYKYIYYKKGRYQSLLLNNDKFNLNDSLGKTISITFVFFSFTLPLLVPIITG